MKVEWSDDLLTGIGIVDAQHKELFVRVQNFFNAIDEGNMNAVSETVDYLAEYVIEHFSAEELYMIKNSYKGFLAHRDEHSKFIKSVYNSKEKIVNEGVTDELVEELKKELVDWLVNHINGVDKHLAEVEKSRSRFNW